MKNLLLILLILGLGISVFSQDATSRQLPQVEIKDLKGNPFNTKDIQNDGKPIIICFWATWCKPCIKELDAISYDYEDWVEETGVKLYAISIDDARSMRIVEPRVNGKGWEYDVLLDPNQDFKRAMNVNNPPHTFILDGERNIVWDHTAYVDGNEQEYIEVVRKLLAGETISEDN